MQSGPHHQTQDEHFPVLTVTVNPAIDVSLDVTQMIPDHKLRARSWVREPGGGGVNVARVLHRLGVGVRAFIVAGGATGSELVEMVEDAGVAVCRYDHAAATRESIAVTETSTGHQYRISAPGPVMTNGDALIDAIVEAASEAQLVVLSGSLCPGLADDVFARVIDRLGPSTTTIVDTSGPALRAVAASSPTLVKPSQRELAALVGWNPTTSDDIERAADEMLEMGGASAIVASRGPAGALLARPDERPLWFHPPPVRPVSTVGAGDSMVAGIAAALCRADDLVEAVRFGVAAGTAAVSTPGSELCQAATVARLLGHVAMWEAGDASPD